MEPPPTVDTLVDDPRLSATRLGATPRITPWSATRLAGIFQAYESSPGYAALAEARLARQCLSQFWLSAPVDQLEVLYRSPIGECYRRLLASGLAREPLLGPEEEWRSTLAERLSTSFERPETTNVLLAVMPYFAPGRMRVADPLSQVPEWLQEDYARLFDPQLLQRIWKPAGLLGPAGRAYGPAPSLGGRSSAPRPGLPQLSARRGNEALVLAQDADFQGRMRGLINLHVIDPGDGQVREQLVELRRLLGQVWLDAPADQLEGLYRSSFGQLYRELLSSGFPKAPLNPDDRRLRSQLAPVVADMSRPGAINALMAVLPFYRPGKIAFGGGEQHMPLWLVREIATIYGEDTADQGGSAPGPNGETPAR